MNDNPLLRSFQRTGAPPPPRCALPASVCTGCGQDIYIGEYRYFTPGAYLCPDCMADTIAELPLGELAALIGYERQLLTD